MSLSSEDDLFDLSDEELEAAFKAAKAEDASPDTDLPTEYEDDTVQEDLVENSEMPDEALSDTEDTTESDLEQPEEDSDHDASEDFDAEPTEDTDVEVKDDNLQEDSSEDGDLSEDTEEPVEDETQKVQKYTFKADGKEYEFTQEEILSQFPKIFGQAMNYTKKMQAIKPWRKTIDAIEQAELTHDDVNLMIDVLKGDKDAITEVIKRTGIDALDLDPEDSNYVPKDYGRDEHTLEIEEIIQEISKDPEYSTTHNILTNQWDEASLETITRDPQMIKLLHEDVRNGTYHKLQPIMDKIKLFDGGSKTDLEYYGIAAREYYSNVTQEQKKQLAAQKAMEERAAAKAQAEAARLEKIRAQEEARKATQQASAKRKAAAPTRTRAGGNNVVDYLDDSDEAFEEWYIKVTGERPVN